MYLFNWYLENDVGRGGFRLGSPTSRLDNAEKLLTTTFNKVNSLQFSDCSVDLKLIAIIMDYN
jgi:hypothetical protein